MKQSVNTKKNIDLSTGLTVNCCLNDPVDPTVATTMMSDAIPVARGSHKDGNKLDIKDDLKPAVYEFVEHKLVLLDEEWRKNCTQWGRREKRWNRRLGRQTLRGEGRVGEGE